jgi:hypothetical protein
LFSILTQPLLRLVAAAENRYLEQKRWDEQFIPQSGQAAYGFGWLRKKGG